MEKQGKHYEVAIEVFKSKVYDVFAYSEEDAIKCIQRMLELGDIDYTDLNLIYEDISIYN